MRDKQHPAGHGHGHGHAHSHEGGIDEVLQSSAEGMRTLWISLAVLGATALGQTMVVAVRLGRAAR
jgi:hypothetical protein